MTIIALESFERAGHASFAWRVRVVAREGGGKSGGYRMISYFGGGALPVYLLDIYAKNVKTDLSHDEKKLIKVLCKELLNSHRDKMT